jgi:tripartite-type tricarboxylate transporter receptor subunit TctC
MSFKKDRTLAAPPMDRRGFLAGAAAGLTLTCVPDFAHAQNRSVRWIVGFAPGGGNDLVARLLGQWLSDNYGPTYVIENREGAAGNIATEAVIHSPPDANTLLLISSNNATNAAANDRVKETFVNGIAPVAAISKNSLVMVVNTNVPAKTVPEFIAYAKANPGKLNMASAGSGGIGHLTGELFKMMTGTDLVHVPFRGNAPALGALLGGHVDVLFPSFVSAKEFIKTGQIRGLAVTSAAPSTDMPELPTVGEFLPGFEAETWYGVGAPKGTPTELIEKLNAQFAAALSDAGIVKRFAEFGDIPTPMTAARFNEFMEQEITKWTKVARFAKL